MRNKIWKKLEEKRLFDSREAAEYIGISYSSLVKFRRNGVGPRYARVGFGKGKILYNPADLDAWIYRHLTQSNEDVMNCSEGLIDIKLIRRFQEKKELFKEEELQTLFKSCYSCTKFFSCDVSSKLGLEIATIGLDQDILE